MKSNAILSTLLLREISKTIRKIRKRHLLSAFLTVEEGGILDGNLMRLDALYEKGIRILTLTWNYENCIGYPNIIPKYRQKGLKPFGLDVVPEWKN